MPRAIVHIVDDDAAVRDGLGALMRVEDLPVRLYASGQALLDAKPRGEGCVVTDAHMPEMTGIELTRRLKALGSRMPVIVVTGRTDRTLRAEAMAAGASAFLDKPFTADELLAAIRAVIEDA
jgi:two-component system response regulator FixJ